MSQSMEQASATSFQVEIMCMLHAFGDVKEPLKETANLIESIVYAQMCSLLVIASDTAVLRDATSVGIEEFIFLLRRNRTKLARFLHHLQFKDMKSGLTKSLDNETVEDAGTQDIGDTIGKQNKRLKICEVFLRVLDDREINMLDIIKSSAFDEIRLKRQERAEKQTRPMDSEQYLRFSQCRAVTFAKKLSRFSRWFENFLQSVDCKPNDIGWEAVAYLAHETVAELVDVAILVQKEQHSDTSLPVRSCNNELPKSQTVFKMNDAIFTASHAETDSSSELSIIKKCALTPSHIREALRRCWFPSQQSCLYQKSMIHSVYGCQLYECPNPAKIICLN